MAFQEIKSLHNSEEYIDIAIKRANKKAGAIKLRKTSKLDRIKTIELTKIEVVNNVLISKLDDIVKQFPAVAELTEFYQKLISISIGTSKFKITLSNIRWTKDKINSMYKRYNRFIKLSKSISDIQKYKNEFYGRIGSLFKQIDKDMKFLEQSRKIMQSFPIIRQKLQQVAIAGFPNVGKSTLLNKLSGSRPEIAAYAFTTKKTMIGYITDEGKKIVQLLDTPGTLNRFRKMNDIEQIAYFVMKLVADKIIYVFDLTDEYPLDMQEELFKRIKEFGKPVIIYLSKTDILDKKKIDDFKKKYDIIDNVDELKKKLIS